MSISNKNYNDPKILVGCVTPVAAEFCIKPFIRSIEEQDVKADTVFVNVTGDEDFTKRLQETGKKAISKTDKDIRTAMLAARNHLRRMALSGEYQYLLLIDIKVMLPKDGLRRLLDAHKDVTSGLYLAMLRIGGKPELAPNIYDYAGHDSVRAMEIREVIGEGLKEIAAAGLGCVLISSAVLEDIEFRFYNEEKRTGDDTAFFLDARRSGYKTYADTGVKCNVLMSAANEKLNDLFSFDSHPPIRNPKVAVCCVTHEKHEQYLDGFLEAIRGQDYPNYDLIFADTSGNAEFSAKLKGTGAKAISAGAEEEHPIKKIVAGRNALRQHVLDNSYDYMLFVDTDIIIPSNAISKLLARRGDVLAGVYLAPANVGGTTRVMPYLYDFDDQEGYCRPMWINDVLGNELKQVFAAGFGCTLISRKALEKTAFRYFEKSMAGEYMAFFTDARKEGFKTLADTGIKCTHLLFPPGDPRNRKFMFDTYSKGESYSFTVEGATQDNRNTYK